MSILPLKMLGNHLKERYMKRCQTGGQRPETQKYTNHGLDTGSQPKMIILVLTNLLIANSYIFQEIGSSWTIAEAVKADELYVCL